MKFTFTIKLIFIVLGLTACNNSSIDNSEKGKSTSEVLLNSSEEISVSKKEKSTSAENSVSQAKVLMVGTFHGDEVMDESNQYKWFGLFKNKTNYYLKRTNIKISLAYDPIIDTEVNDKTGKVVRTSEKDSCLILIEQLPFLKENIIPHINLEEEYILPDETVLFRYLGVEYSLFATADDLKSKDEIESQDFKNYKLYLTATIDGVKSESLLVTHKNFDDRMVKILFIGDIDGDTLLDLIIDVSNHYNATCPSIFLSKPSNKGELIRLIGSHTSVGC